MDNITLSSSYPLFCKDKSFSKSCQDYAHNKYLESLWFCPLTSKPYWHSTQRLFCHWNISSVFTHYKLLLFCFEDVFAYRADLSCLFLPLYNVDFKMTCPHLSVCLPLCHRQRGDAVPTGSLPTAMTWTNQAVSPWCIFIAACKLWLILPCTRAN